jgi:hypothetical protein
MIPIKAEFANHKRIASRKVLQIILEVPEEATKEVFDALGYPNSSKSIWVAVVRLKEEPIENDVPPFVRDVEV